MLERWFDAIIEEARRKSASSRTELSADPRFGCSDPRTKTLLIPAYSRKHGNGLTLFYHLWSLLHACDAMEGSFKNK